MNLTQVKLVRFIKEDNKDILENYKPVSTLPIFEKILEKAIFSRLYSFIASQKYFLIRRFEFRKQHSSNHAMNYSVTHVTCQKANF